jgi:hypothetical protein
MDARVDCCKELDEVHAIAKRDVRGVRGENANR